MKLELQALATLKTYCARPDGKYPAPADLLTLGPPDMPVKSVEVESYKEHQTRAVMWFYPYKRLASEERGVIQQQPTNVICESPKVNAE